MRTNYPARINLKCSVCEKDFNRPPSLVKKVKKSYCSKECADIGQTTAPRFQFTCEECGKKFTQTKDHGADRRFCSRKCFRAKAIIELTERECAYCGDIFKPSRSTHTEDGINKFCSKKCFSDSLKNGEEIPCLNCGKMFYTNPSHSNTCCSMKCKSEYYRGQLAPAWKGGGYVAEYTGHKFVALERPDRVGKYIAEHRMVAIQHIGRLLEQWEKVIHLNSISDDNSPENLYICGTNSQMRKLFNGTLPWPKKSNLKEYK